MNLLEAFYYVFAADASALDRGLSESEKEAKRLRDTVSATDAAADKLGTSFVSLAKSAAGLLGVGLTLGGLKMLAMGTAETTSELGKQARQMNVNVSTLDAWRKAVEESGGDANDFTNTLGNMAQRFRDPEAALLRYSKALGGMSSFRAQRLGKMIGLDEGTIELLRKGKVSVEELVKKQKEQGVITKQQVEMTDKFNQDLRTLKMSFDGLKTEIGLALIPALQYLLKKWNELSKWAKDNKKPLTDVFTAIAAIVTMFYLPAMIRAAIATFAALWPIALMVIGVVLLGIAVADLIGYMNGMNSVTGQLIKKFPELEFVIRGVANAMGFFKSAGDGMADALIKAASDPVESFNKLIKLINDIIDAIFGLNGKKSVFERAADTAREAFEKLEGIVKDIFKDPKEFFTDANKQADGVIDTVKHFFFGSLLDKGKEQADLPTIPNDMTFGGADYLNSMPVGAVSNMSSNNIATSKTNTVSKKTDIRIDNLTLETQATDAQGIANDFSGALADVYQHNNDGMSA